MVVVPLKKTIETAGESRGRANGTTSLAGMAAAGALAAGSILFVTGKRRAGLVTALSGAALAMLDQHELVGAWWDALPGCLSRMQNVLGRAQAAVEDLTEQGEKLRRALGK